MKFDDVAGIGLVDDFSRGDGCLADKKLQVPVFAPARVAKTDLGKQKP
jgi:hypothetical protein